VQKLRKAHCPSSIELKQGFWREEDIFSKKERRKDLGDEGHILFGVMFCDNAVPPPVIRCIVHTYARPRGYLRCVYVGTCVCVCVNACLPVSLSLSLSLQSGLRSGDGIDI
jgi:hypothetical protein